MKLIRLLLFIASVAFLGLAHAQTITTAPQSQVVAVGGTATFSVTATAPAGAQYLWRQNGTAVLGAVQPTLTVTNVQPQHAGIYTVSVTSGTNVVTASAILGITTTAKVVGAGSELAANILHPTGNIFDQVQLSGAAASVTADAGQATRMSYIDVNDDIVQVEFAGAGTLTVVLDAATGPATPLKYNQPSTSYMKGHATIVIAGADETTNATVFSVGRANAINQALFRSDVNYDGVADIAAVAIVGGNGKFGGLRTANASYFATKGITGVYAPGIQFTGPVFVGSINAFDAARPALVLGAASDTRITGGDLLQNNGQSVEVSGITLLKFTDGSTSQGFTVAAKLNQATLVQNGTNITTQIAPRASSTLYVAQLRPPSGATDSTASGYATILIAANGSATVNVFFSNLAASQTAAHLGIGSTTDFALNLPLGQVSGRGWTFTATATATSYDLINALNSGNIFVGLDSAKYTSGELRGNFVPATGSQTFTAPAAPPALASSALTAPSQTDAARFLTQATFGPTTATINALMARGITGWIDDQMALPATSMLGTLRADLAAFPKPPIPAILGDERFAWGANWHAAWWKQAVTSPDQLRQRVAFALSEILVVGLNDTLEFNMESKGKYYDLLVNRAFGNYRALLEDVTLSPAMGLYLSHVHNLKPDPTKGTQPDENYARELQQLFTIGLVQLQPDGTLMLDSSGQPIPTYNQTTISETAKVLTGWSWATSPESITDEGNYIYGSPSVNTIYPASLPNDNAWLNPMRYYDFFHDKTAKAIVSVQQVPLAQAQPTAVPAGKTGPQDLAILLDTVFNHPNTGPFVSRQLIQRLVTSNPSPGYVYRVAQKFANDGTGTRGNLGAVVRAILTDYEARSPAVLNNVGYGKVKEPLVRMTALLRALNIAAPNGRYMDSYFEESRYGSYQYTPTSSFAGPGTQIGQEPLNSPTVFNFFSPTYSPPGAMAAAGLVAPELEITDSNYGMQTPNFLTYLIYRNGTTPIPPPAGVTSPFLVVDYSALLPNARTPTALVDQLNLLFTANQMSAGTRTAIINGLSAMPTAATDLERVQSALQLVLVSADGAVQK